MYLEHFGLTEFPFSTVPDPRFYYPTAKHREALACLLYTVEQRKGFALITGEIGAGKTMLCHAALERLPNEVDVASIVHTSLSPTEFLQAVAGEFGVEADGGSKVALLRALRDFLLSRLDEDRTVVLLVDEAQALSQDVLEELRLLGNLETPTHKLMQILLVGQPELRELVRTSRMRPLVQRMAIMFHLGTLTAEDADGYIAHRLRVAGGPGAEMFEPAARQEAFRASGGVPRVVNIICDQAMLQSYVRDEEVVSADTVRDVVAELDGFYMDEASPAERPRERAAEGDRGESGHAPATPATPVRVATHTQWQHRDASGRPAWRRRRGKPSANGHAATDHARDRGWRDQHTRP